MFRLKQNKNISKKKDERIYMTVKKRTQQQTQTHTHTGEIKNNLILNG